MDIPNEDEYWRRNLAICLFGSFATVFAMTLVLPFLPLYVEELGVRGHSAVVQWSGVAFGANFLAAGVLAPLWGRLGDRYGRKPMLVRASLGMALIMPLMGMATNVWQFLGLRVLAGVAGGYSSGATILVAVQAPKHRVGWALGLLASGVMAGNLLGPLAGGSLPPLIGIRATFWLSGILIFIAFLGTALWLREQRGEHSVKNGLRSGVWADVSNKSIVFAMLGTGLLLTVANMSIEPIITVFVSTLVKDPARVTLFSGIVMSTAALGSIVSASRLGKVADCIGHTRVIVIALGVAGLLLIPQAFVTNAWQLVVLRFFMGLSLGGLLPCIAAVIRHNVPENFVGAAMGYSLSSQFGGQVLGPLIGGYVGGQVGMRAVFIGTSILLLFGAGINALIVRRSAASM